MKIENLVIAGGLLYVLLMDQLNKIGYSFAGVQVKDADGTGATIILDLDMTNNSSVPITITNFTGSLYSMDDYLGDIGLINPVDVESKAVGRIRIGARITYIGAGLTILNLIQTGNPTLRVKGRLYFGNRSIPVNTTFQVC